MSSVRKITGRAERKPVGRSEMRKQLLSVFLPLLATMLVAAAETQSTGNEASKRVTFQKVDVVRTETGINVEITARGQVTPKLSALDRPDRLVVDLPNTVMASSRSHVIVEGDLVKGIRIGMDAQTPPTTRIVIDLAQSARYELVPGNENKVVLKLAPAVSAKATKAPVNAIAAAKPATKPQSVATLAAIEENPPQPVATEFTFVEPSYSPKEDSATEKPAAKPEPSARAQSAAVKFVERPETVLPEPSASMQAGAATAAQPAVNMAAEQKAQMAQQPVTNGPKYTGEPISVNLKDVDLKDFFRLIHEISGLNVVLDPNVKGTLTIVLDDVPWDQALDIVVKNNELSRQLDGNVLSMPPAVGGAQSGRISPVQIANTVIGGAPNYILVGTQQIPLFSNLPVTQPTSGLTFTNESRNYRIDAILTMAESRGLLKILSRPRVVTQNNIQALVRQGVRVPIVTQAQLGGPPTVTYVDAFLRLTVVPQITSEGTIFLNVDVENTTPDFGRTVQGNPTLVTQQATTQVLVTDGGTVVIGGVIQTQNSVNISQVPLLGNIPAFGNLFKRRSVSTSNQELIFFITPRIIQT